MIVRSWRGRAATANQAAYPTHFRAAVLPELQRIAGFGGATLLCATTAEAVEFLVLTRWESMAAIRAFAGDDAEHAVVAPEAAAALIDFDPLVRHYDVIEEA